MAQLTSSTSAHSGHEDYKAQKLGPFPCWVDYFLTAAISALSGMLYLSVVLPAIGPQTHFLGLSVTLWITLLILVLLGILNWVGVSESARVSMVGAVIAFASDVAILVTVFAHISFPQFLALFPLMFSGKALSPVTLLVGYAGSFLAFSGLESISQLSPVMKLPRRVVGKIALFLVILKVGLTSPLLTMLSTLLLPRAAADPVLSSYIISLLAGRWGGAMLQTEVAVSASALLVFASNTAIIGSYASWAATSQAAEQRGSPEASSEIAKTTLAAPPQQGREGLIGAVHVGNITVSMGMEGYRRHIKHGHYRGTHTTTILCVVYEL